MPRITKVYTRQGDGGDTSLGGGQKVPKDSPRIEAYGTVDELNSAIGLALAMGVVEEVARALAPVRNELFHLGSDLCFLEEDKRDTPVPCVEPRHVEALEKLMDRLSAAMAPLANFVLPGGAPGAAALHLARAVCRRAERCVVALSRAEPVNPVAVRYLNRLSDALFVLARFENHRRGVAETCWDSRA